MGAIMYREEAIVVKKGSFFSLVETGGMMHKAFTASDGYYLFSEVGAGTKALVLVGAWHETGYFLTSERKGIKNKRLGKENQDIYASAGVYTPRQLKGLFPGHE